MSAVRDSSTYQQYSKISYGNQIYREKDAVLIKGSDNLEVAIINHIYDSNGEHLLNVRKFIFARHLKKLFRKQDLDYDRKSEVVEDLTQCYDISLKQIVKKCSLVILCLDDHVDYIGKNHLDASYNFSCRFSIKGNQLFPYTDKYTNLNDNEFITPSNKKNMDIENTPTALANNNIELHIDDDYCSPAQRNQVKRNLNTSFGNSPSSKHKSILNYSIESLSDDEADNEKLIFKFRVSRNQNLRSPKKRNALNSGDSVTSPPKIRKSTRTVCRKSYAEYISPEKTPTKRRLGSIRISEDEDFGKNKVSKKTPKNSDCSKYETDQNATPSKRIIKVTQRYNEELSSAYQRTPLGTPARRSLRLSQMQDTDENLDDNLDDSLRTNLLRNTFRKLDLDENEKNLINRPPRSPLDSESEDNTEKINLDDSYGSKIMRINLQRLDLSNEAITNDSDSDSSDYKSTPKKKKPTKVSSDVNGTPKSSKKLSKTTNNTPKSSRTSKSTPKSEKGTPKRTPNKTPTVKNRAKLIRDGIVTPSMQERSRKITENSTPLMEARSKLHVSYVPESLPCREKEYCDIYNFIEGRLLDGCGGCMYVSGVPGTGKTATVTSVINHLQHKKDVPTFTFVNINGMKLTEPRQSYVEILKQLSGKTISWEQAQNSLDDMFVKVKKMKPIVMLIDELDILCTKRQDVVYNLLDWPTKAKNQLVVISIANTMDLPERLLMNRVTSRLGLTRLTFQPYNFKQLQEIVTKRLCGTDSFNPDAVQFVARKVASVSGDARRALDICRRAAEIAETEGKSQLVNMSHVNDALSAMITQPKVLAIKSCSRLEQLILQSIVAEVERTGVEETTFVDVYKMLITCAAIEGFQIVSSTIAQSAISRLSACRLILAEQKCNNIYQKIILNVSIDDVYYALQKNRS